MPLPAFILEQMAFLKASNFLAKQGRTEVWFAVVGDGALTGGMSWEALNNIAADKERKLSYRRQ
jgi:deoxyxylulose-5-phosphate synthase